MPYPHTYAYENEESKALNLSIKPSKETFNASAIVSWNFKHLVNFEKIKQYNVVNLREGYKMINIGTKKNNSKLWILLKKSKNAVEWVRQRRNELYEEWKRDASLFWSSVKEAGKKFEKERLKKEINKAA